VSHECVDLSAAFAYFTLQSIFPLLLIALAVVANVIGKAESLDYLFASLSPVLPPSALDLVETTLRGLVDQGFGAGLFGVVVLLVTASNAFLTLQRGADRLWEEWMPSPTQSQSFSFQAIQFIRSRLEAFMIVLLLASLLLVEQVVVGFRQLPDELLATLQQFAPELSLLLRTGPVTRLGQILVPTLFLSLLALLLQRVLPSRRVPLRPLIPGSLLIGFSLTILNSVLSLSIISLGNRYQAYGVIGGVLVLTLWVWLVGLILYFGQCWSVELSLRLRQPAQGQPNLTSA
jgi:membrane protein